MRRRAVALTVKFRIVRFVFLEDVVDGGQQHSGNGDDGFLVASTLFECNIAISDFRELPSTDSTKGTLNKKRLDVGSSPTDSGSFLLPGTLVVLRHKTSPGAEMLRGGEHGHIHSDFRDNANRGKGLDTRHRHTTIHLILSSQALAHSFLSHVNELVHILRKRLCLPISKRYT